MSVTLSGETRIDMTTESKRLQVLNALDGIKHSLDTVNSIVNKDSIKSKLD